ncbi:RidA family protein [Clostridium mediterraneense]|uniref:RidA family protein n=1 Tax=Clostridium mediterraneense TaxID=1805472 RepID=UPI000A06A886|nr:RidA family protein [Clostridium mediterraneense]
MMKEIIKTDKAPGAIGPYSQGVRIENLIFTSGQIAINPQTGKISESIEEQTKQVLENIKEILEAGGTNINNVIKTTVFLKNMNDFEKMNSIYETYFINEKPARSAIEVSRLPKDVKIEIEVIAHI